MLAFTLEKLYRGYASDGKLELQEYVALGGMEGSIQTCIERIVPRDSLSTSDAAALRLSFVKHLAQANDQGEVVRLRARWDELPAAAKPILEKFVNERLLIRPENTDEDKSERRSVSIEVAHEAMFRCWSDLKEWLRTSADMLRWRRDVRRDQANDPQSACGLPNSPLLVIGRKGVGLLRVDVLPRSLPPCSPSILSVAYCSPLRLRKRYNHSMETGGQPPSNR